MKMGTRYMTFCVLGLLFAAAAQAQDVQGGCPALPASTGLTWEYQNVGDADFCRALREDGSEAFGMFISKDPAFSPKRSDRAEEGVIDGRKVTWYRSELAGKPDIIARETLLELGKNRTAHIWVQVGSQEQLQETYRQASSLEFNPQRQLSSN
ncbi:hypothetical protein [Marilutibacter alkalisoli]|uniref:Uncharacterized protein n=1 Tax=Marilutibacter alkalisoli TaxID=2591633 RepID=A0A514BRP9_9GAMM|nr:hypothetical protein [Lysobacter alkalisoli]QDH69689.1 hypothetical protein FKV23_05960 [Lysobacter alkalisoli]